MSDQRPSKERGIYHKFNVVRTDGKSAPGQKHHDCFYFVLDCDHDPHARAALLAYAASCEADYPALASDVRAIVESGAAFGSGEDKHVSDAVTIQPAHEPGDLRSDLQDYLRAIGAPLDGLAKQSITAFLMWREDRATSTKSSAPITPAAVEMFFNPDGDGDPRDD